jgi:hypothetical protein
VILVVGINLSIPPSDLGSADLMTVSEVLALAGLLTLAGGAIYFYPNVRSLWRRGKRFVARRRHHRMST